MEEESHFHSDGDSPKLSKTEGKLHFSIHAMQWHNYFYRSMEFHVRRIKRIQKQTWTL